MAGTASHAQGNLRVIAAPSRRLSPGDGIRSPGFAAGNTPLARHSDKQGTTLVSDHRRPHRYRPPATSANLSATTTVNDQDAIVVVFGKEQVLHCKPPPIKRFGPTAPPAGPDLAALMGWFSFLVEGYDGNPLELLRFISRNFVPLNTMMERAGMSEMDIHNRSRDVFHHFTCGCHCPVLHPPQS